MKRTRATKRVVLTTHELGLSKDVDRITRTARALRAELHQTIKQAKQVRERAHKLCNDSNEVWQRIREEAKQRPTLVQIKASSLREMPCQTNCVETKCEHYLDCLSVVNMCQYVLNTDPDPKTLMRLYILRNDAIDAWQKKGIFRGCMFKVPHGSPIIAQQHADLLAQDAPRGVHFYAYKCKYGEHYHVAHTKASEASLRRIREKFTQEETVLG